VACETIHTFFTFYVFLNPKKHGLFTFLSCCTRFLEMMTLTRHKLLKSVNQYSYSILLYKLQPLLLSHCICQQFNFKSIVTLNVSENNSCTTVTGWLSANVQGQLVQSLRVHMYFQLTFRNSGVQGSWSFCCACPQWHWSPHTLKWLNRRFRVAYAWEAGAV